MELSCDCACDVWSVARCVEEWELGLPGHHIGMICLCCVFEEQLRLLQRHQYISSELKHTRNIPGRLGFCSPSASPGVTGKTVDPGPGAGFAGLPAYGERG